MPAVRLVSEQLSFVDVRLALVIDPGHAGCACGPARWVLAKNSPLLSCLGKEDWSRTETDASNHSILALRSQQCCPLRLRN